MKISESPSAMPSMTQTAALTDEITPWMDGGLVYGPFKAWTDAIRRFEKGELASQGIGGSRSKAGQDSDIADLLPMRNDIGLPLANPPLPAKHSLLPVNRFWSELKMILKKC